MLTVSESSVPNSMDTPGVKDSASTVDAMPFSPPTVVVHDTLQEGGAGVITAPLLQGTVTGVVSQPQVTVVGIAQPQPQIQGTVVGVSAPVSQANPF